MAKATDKITTDHEEIKKWAEKNNGKPALIDHIDAKGDLIGIRINFPGEEDEALLSAASPSKNISWDEFFRIFEEQQLTFVYNNNPKGKDPTLWYYFKKRTNQDKK